MIFPTWGQLTDNFCSVERNNPYYEEFAARRYNYAASNDRHSCRLIFLKDVVTNPSYKTLRRKGRFVWCRNLKYEGINSGGVREISFTVDKGQKRFHIGENNVLCLPSHICVSNHRYFKPKLKTFFPFSTVFSYKNSLNMMVKNSDYKNLEELLEAITKDNPYQPGTLVMPRRGYFYPELNPDKINKEIVSHRQHPCGIILGPAINDNDYVVREFYRVRFGDTTYEKVHPVQMEIINEV